MRLFAVADGFDQQLLERLAIKLHLAQHIEDLSAERLARTRTLMNEAVRDCLVTGYEDLIASLSLPDPNDRHVLAAAIKGRTDVIVTLNLRDFPAERLDRWGIEAQHPDEFLTHQFHLSRVPGTL